MAGYITLKTEIIRGGIGKYLTPIGPSPLNVFPLFTVSPIEPVFSERLVFEGQSVSEDGKQHFLCASASFKRTVLLAIHYLMKFGYSFAQAYMLLSCVPGDAHIYGLVDVPNACTGFSLPVRIFDDNLLPTVEGEPQKVDRGSAPTVPYEGKLPVTKPAYPK